MLPPLDDRSVWPDRVSPDAAPVPKATILCRIAFQKWLVAVVSVVISVAKGADHPGNRNAGQVHMPTRKSDTAPIAKIGYESYLNTVSQTANLCRMIDASLNTPSCG